MNNLIICERCKKSLYDSSFFRYKKNREICPICKKCINIEVTENGKLALYKWTKEFDIPFIEKEWEYVKRYGEGLFSKYLGILYLPAYRKFSYEDSKILNQEEE